MKIDVCCRNVKMNNIPFIDNIFVTSVVGEFVLSVFLSSQ